MGTTLTGTTPATTYDGLIKVTDNGPLSGTAKYLSDGLGNDSVLALSTSLVGIGTNAPQRPLHINGTEGVLRLTSTASGNNGFEVGIGASSQAFLWQAENSYIQIATNATERLRISAEGDVGIGITTFGNFSTSKELLIKGDAVNTNAVAQVISNDSGSSLAMYAGANSTDHPLLIYQKDLRFGSATSTGLVGYAEKMRITAAGNVGIGTSAPTYRLNVLRSDGQVAFLTDGTTADLAITCSSGVTSMSPTTGILAFGTSSTERMRIDSSGNVGIGITPTARLHVSGTIQSVQGATTIQMYTTGGSGVISQVGAYPLTFLTNSAERMRITAAGNVGIGATISSWGGTFRALQIGAGTAIYNNDAANGSFFGSNYFYNGTNNIYKNDGTATAYGQISGNHSFFTASGGSAGGTVSFSERVTITANGLTFNGDTAAANALDDYEEGTFNPTIIGGTTAGTADYVRAARYTKIGRQVTVQIDISWTSGTGAGSLQISGLPFNESQSATNPAVSIGFISDISLSASHYALGYIANSTNRIDLVQYPVGGSTLAAVSYSASGRLILNATYLA